MPLELPSRPARPRVLVMGGTGMLGHKLVQVLAPHLELAATVRGDREDLAALPPFVDLGVPLLGVAASDPASIAGALSEAEPEVVINCIGVVKQAAAAADPIAMLEANALLPHRLARWCRDHGARLIHISTDCVFSGSGGRYREHEPPDPVDLYGHSKLLGEVTGAGVVTLRTSMIGRELSRTTGLLEWFLSQRGRSVTGYRRAVFSGLTTLALARLLLQLVTRQPDLEGLYHVASEPITKLDLLCRLGHALACEVAIEAGDGPAIDRSLDGSRFTADTGIRVPAWDKMLADLAHDPTPYEQWRNRYGAT